MAETTDPTINTIYDLTPKMIGRIFDVFGDDNGQGDILTKKALDLEMAKIIHDLANPATVTVTQLVAGALPAVRRGRFTYIQVDTENEVASDDMTTIDESQSPVAFSDWDMIFMSPANGARTVRVNESGTLTLKQPIQTMDALDRLVVMVKLNGVWSEFEALPGGLIAQRLARMTMNPSNNTPDSNDLLVGGTSLVRVHGAITGEAPGNSRIQYSVIGAAGSIDVRVIEPDGEISLTNGPYVYGGSPTSSVVEAAIIALIVANFGDHGYTVVPIGGGFQRINTPDGVGADSVNYTQVVETTGDAVILIDEFFNINVGTDGYEASETVDVLLDVAPDQVIYIQNAIVADVTNNPEPTVTISSGGTQTDENAHFSEYLPAGATIVLGFGEFAIIMIRETDTGLTADVLFHGGRHQGNKMKSVWVDWASWHPFGGTVNSGGTTVTAAGLSNQDHAAGWDFADTLNDAVGTSLFLPDDFDPLANNGDAILTVKCAAANTGQNFLLCVLQNGYSVGAPLGAPTIQSQVTAGGTVAAWDIFDAQYTIDVSGYVAGDIIPVTFMRLGNDGTDGTGTVMIFGAEWKTGHL